MPKTHSEFPNRLFFNCSDELHTRIVALAYLRGAGGSYASLARNFIMIGLREAEEAMTERERADYREILENVKATEEIKKAPL